MRLISKALILLLVLTGLNSSKAAVLPILPGPVNQGDLNIKEANTFPELKSKNLEGKEYLLPKDLESKINILVLAYKRDQQNAVDAWLTAIKEKNLDICPEVTAYEVPVLKQFNTFIRFNIDNGMRYGINDKEKREHVLSIYVDKESFNEILNISTEETVHTLVVRQDGKILWQKEGEVTNEKITELESFLKGLLD